MTRLDSSAAWKSATALVSANRDVLVALAGVFFLLPALVDAVFMPTPQFATGQSEQQIAQALMAYYADSFPMLLLLSLLPMIGMLTMLVVMLDPDRPTVGHAIRRSIGAVPSYFAAQFLVGLVILPFVTVVMAALSIVLPATLAAAMAMVMLVYPLMRAMMIGPVLAGGRDRNPIAAIRRSLAITHGNTGRMLAFIGLAMVVFFVIYGLTMMVVGVALVLTTGGETQRLLAEGISSVVLAVGYTFFVAMLAAIYRQLAGVERRDAPSVFE